MSVRSPLLVVVAGAPGSGKSTLGRQIATELGLPFLTRDELTERLADGYGETASLSETERLVRGAVAVFYSVATELLRSGCGIVLEQAFRRGVAEAQLRPLVALSEAVLIHCSAPREVCVERYVARSKAGLRHPVHRDQERIARVMSGDRPVDWARFAPLELGVPC
jgi:predicted kinase